ncbi:hypothetical protein [Mycobacterium avium]|uniref:hypothetical protein n=1 Tax=Mycobacterium avium TaxID=1764 RepID=UPI000A90AEEC|nr:hypothetical protein [Mycobacterium avium]
MSEEPTSSAAQTNEPHDPQVDAPYRYLASDELDRAAAALVKAGKVQVWVVTDTEAPSMRIDGPCANCGDDYSQTRVLNLASSAVRGAHSAPEPPPRAEVSADFLCDCDITHPGAPPGERGCGASYTIVAAI